MGILEEILKELDAALGLVQIKREPYDLSINEEDFPFSDGRTLMFLDGQFVLVDYERGQLRNKQVFDDKLKLMYALLDPFISEKASSLATKTPEQFRQTYFENNITLFLTISLEFALWKKQEISEILKRYPD